MMRITTHSSYWTVCSNRHSSLPCRWGNTAAYLITV
nr:MAG TPA: hypothetical protein [Caudoviricetes sp.]